MKKLSLKLRYWIIQKAAGDMPVLMNMRIHLKPQEPQRVFVAIPREPGIVFNNHFSYDRDDGPVMAPLRDVDVDGNLLVYTRVSLGLH